jgi:predicted negative regulator of RcsB-dependent stress response
LETAVLLDYTTPIIAKLAFLTMARKKRRIEPAAVATNEPKEKPRYQDQFQQRVGSKVEEAGKKLEGHGRTILYGLAALAVLGIIAWIVYAWSGRSNAAAQAALGKAIEISQTRVSAEPVPAGSTEKTFKTERERAEAAVAEFDKVAQNHGGDVGEKARYFAAVNRLSLDRGAAIASLEDLSKANDEVGKLAKFALAQTRAEDNRPDDAIAIYQELAGMSDSIVSKETINLELAKLYEKQGKKNEAVDLLFNLVKTASEAKDSDGKAIPLSASAQSAKEKLAQLDPEKAKQIPEPPPESPLGGMGGIPFGQ